MKKKVPSHLDSRESRTPFTSTKVPKFRNKPLKPRKDLMVKKAK